jgi:hypothetical protein
LHYYDELIVRAMQYLGYNDPNNAWLSFAVTSEYG